MSLVCEVFGVSPVSLQQEGKALHLPGEVVPVRAT